MLSKKEKQEMLEDARNNKRKDAFSCINLKAPDKVKSFDSYLKFLTELQKITKHSVKHGFTITKENKL